MFWSRKPTDRQTDSMSRIKNGTRFPRHSVGGLWHRCGIRRGRHPGLGAARGVEQHQRCRPWQARGLGIELSVCGHSVRTGPPHVPQPVVRRRSGDLLPRRHPGALFGLAFSKIKERRAIAEDTQYGPRNLVDRCSCSHPRLHRRTLFRSRLSLQRYPLERNDAESHWPSMVLGISISNQRQSRHHQHDPAGEQA